MESDWTEQAWRPSVLELHMLKQTGGVKSPLLHAPGCCGSGPMQAKLPRNPPRQSHLRSDVFGIEPHPMLKQPTDCTKPAYEKADPHRRSEAERLVPASVFAK